MVRVLVVLSAWMVLVGIVAFAAWSLWARAQVRRRLTEAGAGDEADDEDIFDRGPLAHWLFLAGFQQREAPASFVASVVAALVAGLTTAYLISRSGLLTMAARSAAQMPGGMGSIAQPILRISPWVLLILLTAVPLTIVRAARRRRVAEVERDLPITLELLATLAEAGIGFDAATRRILDSQSSERALASELRTLQADLLAGRSRVDCLRRVARRLDVISVTIFISAIVQAEQIGSGVAAVLRQQADDLRQRRRERALEFSMALPVKQMFPLVICFLPGILIFAIGPLFAEFLKYSNSFGALGKH